MGTWHFGHSLLYQSPHKQAYSDHSERSDLLHTTPSTHSKICCWATTILAASTPTYIFAIPCIIPAYSSVELQVTRNPVISIYKQQSSFGIRQLDMAPAKRWCFCKSAFCPLEIPMFKDPLFPLQPHQLLGLLSFQSFNSSSGSLIVQWLFGDYIPRRDLSGSSRYWSYICTAIPCSNPLLTVLSLDGGLWFPSVQTRHEDRPWLWLSE